MHLQASPAALPQLHCMPLMPSSSDCWEICSSVFPVQYTMVCGAFFGWAINTSTQQPAVPPATAPPQSLILPGHCSLVWLPNLLADAPLSAMYGNGWRCRGPTTANLHGDNVGSVQFAPLAQALLLPAAAQRNTARQVLLASTMAHVTPQETLPSPLPQACNPSSTLELYSLHPLHGLAS
jgi:hypothetical protein